MRQSQVLREARETGRDIGRCVGTAIDGLSITAAREVELVKDLRKALRRVSANGSLCNPQAKNVHAAVIDGLNQILVRRILWRQDEDKMAEYDASLPDTPCPEVLLNGERCGVDVPAYAPTAYCGYHEQGRPERRRKLPGEGS